MANTVNLGELPAGLCRDGITKEKARFDLRIARGAKENKKRFYRHLNQKRKVQDVVYPLVSDRGKLVTKDKEKSEVLNNIFSSVFSDNCSSQSPLMNGSEGGGRFGEETSLLL